jgi:hypothetical protein
MSDQLYILLNEFYEDIRPDLAQAVLSAIKAAQNNGEINEDMIIVLLAAPHFNDERAINIYLTNVRQDSVTIPFFVNFLQIPQVVPPAIDFVADPPAIQVPNDFFVASPRVASPHISDIPEEFEARAPGIYRL